MSAPTRTPSWVFWLGQLLGWGLIGLSGLAMTVLLFGSTPNGLLVAAMAVGLETLQGFLWTSLLRTYYLRLALVPLRPLVVRSALACLAATVAWPAVTLAFWVAVHRAGISPKLPAEMTGVLHQAPRLAPLLWVFFTDLFNTLAWSALYWGLRALAESRERSRATLQAQALANEAQLQMLRYQLNPHFLFNSLNSVRGLIAEDPARAELMVTELADFLRYSLSRSDAPDVTVREELEAVRTYVALEKVRFEERLQVEWDVDPAALGCRVPGFLLHPLVENAVKYGIETAVPPARVRVEVRRAGERLHVRVANSGRWVEPGQGVSRGTGMGLRNVRARLEHAHPGRCDVQVGPGTDGGVEVVLVLPALPAQAAAPGGLHVVREVLP